MEIRVMAPSELAGFVNAHAGQALAAPAPAASRPPQFEPGFSQLAAACHRDFLEECADALWDICSADLDQRAHLLNARLRESSLIPILSDDEQLGWLCRDHVPGDSVLRDLLTVSLLHAVMTHGWVRIGTCSAHDCVDIFIDDSHRRPRRYCSDTCLNRGRVRAHRKRAARGNRDL